MDTNEIRALIPWNDPCAQCATHTIGHRLDAVIGAIRTVADALDELDERTRPEGTPEPGPDTCDTLGPDTDTAPAPSTIPGCYCRDCKWLRLDPPGGMWCANPRASGCVDVPEGYGCVFGARREAEYGR